MKKIFYTVLCFVCVSGGDVFAQRCDTIFMDTGQIILVKDIRLTSKEAFFYYCEDDTIQKLMYRQYIARIGYFWEAESAKDSAALQIAAPEEKKDTIDLLAPLIKLFRQTSRDTALPHQKKVQSFCCDTLYLTNGSQLLAIHTKPVYNGYRLKLYEDGGKKVKFIKQLYVDSVKYAESSEYNQMNYYPWIETHLPDFPMEKISLRQQEVDSFELHFGLNSFQTIQLGAKYINEKGWNAAFYLIPNRRLTYRLDRIKEFPLQIHHLDITEHYLLWSGGKRWRINPERKDSFWLGIEAGSGFAYAKLPNVRESTNNDGNPFLILGETYYKTITPLAHCRAEIGLNLSKEWNVLLGLSGIYESVAPAVVADFTISIKY